MCVVCTIVLQHLAEQASPPHCALTLRITDIPPFVAESVTRYALSRATTSEADLSLHIPFLRLPEDYLFNAHVFNPPTQEINKVLEALQTAKLPNGPICDIDGGLVVKFGSRFSVTEALAMDFVSRCTNIPVPTVRMCFRHSGMTYIVMTRVEGQTLQNRISDMTTHDLRQVATRLAEYMQELRDLRTGLKVAMGQWPCGPYDNVMFDPPPIGAFSTAKEFHAYWIWRLSPRTRLECIPASMLNSESFNVVLAHGDLGARNIMVQGSAITGILDWETFGWYPDFWDRMMAMRGASPSEGADDRWEREVGAALGVESDISNDYQDVLADIFFREWMG